jgi:hypothetical protein
LSDAHAFLATYNGNKSLATNRRTRLRELEDEIQACASIERPLLESSKARCCGLPRMSADAAGLAH